MSGRSPRRELVFLGHAVDRSGPPIYLLHLLRWLARHQAMRPTVVSLEAGELVEEYRAVSDLVVVGEPDPVRVSRGSRPLTAVRDSVRRRRLRSISPDAVLYVNTAWSIRALRYLPDHRGPVIAHIHELDVGLDYHLAATNRDILLQRPVRWIAASQAVADNLADRWGVARSAILVHHEMIDTDVVSAVAPTAARDLRASLGIPAGSLLLGTAAVLNWRKGPDLMLELAARLDRERPDLDVHVVWLGVTSDDRRLVDFEIDARRAGVAGRVHFVEASARPEVWMHAFDVFVLSAREDAYPLACLEAAAAGRPILCFDAGGITEFVGLDAGVVVPFPDVGRMAEAAAGLGDDAHERRRLGEIARARVRERHDVGGSASRLWEDLEPWLTAPT